MALTVATDDEGRPLPADFTSMPKDAPLDLLGRMDRPSHPGQETPNMDFSAPPAPKPTAGESGFVDAPSVALKQQVLAYDSAIDALEAERQAAIRESRNAPDRTSRAIAENNVHLIETKIVSLQKDRRPLVLRADQAEKREKEQASAQEDAQELQTLREQESARALRDGATPDEAARIRTSDDPTREYDKWQQEVRNPRQAANKEADSSAVKAQEDAHKAFKESLAQANAIQARFGVSDEMRDRAQSLLMDGASIEDVRAMFKTEGGDDPNKIAKEISKNYVANRGITFEGTGEPVLTWAGFSTEELSRALPDLSPELRVVITNEIRRRSASPSMAERIVSAPFGDVGRPTSSPTEKAIMDLEKAGYDLNEERKAAIRRMSPEQLAGFLADAIGS